MSQTAERPGRVLATLPGMVRGIVGVDDSGPRKVWLLQCERCLEVEQADMLVLMQTRFHARSRGGDNPRLCPSCRREAYEDCYCESCAADRQIGKGKK